MTALTAAGIELRDVGEAGGRAAVDHPVDAAMAARSAQRLLAGRGGAYPDPPEVDERTGQLVAICAVTAGAAPG